MKKIHLYICLLFVLGEIKSQSCLPEGIWFGNQNQIDSFQFNYPGCNMIEGDVILSGNDITNLEGLSILTGIGGGLSVGMQGAGLPLLTSLDGLDGITSIGGSLGILWNYTLSDITGLNNLIFLGGSLDINHNYELSSLEGLNSLTSIGGNLQLWENQVLQNLEGLHNLDSIYGSLSISENEGLTSLSSLASLTFISDYLSVFGNHALNSLAGLENLHTLAGGVYIGSCDDSNQPLTNLNGLEGLDSIGESLCINCNLSLMNLDGIENLVYIGENLMLDNNLSLASISAMEELTFLGGDLFIRGNAIQTLEQISGLEFGDSHITIWGTLLTDLSGLEGLVSAEGLTITGNQQLENLTGLINLLSLKGDIEISSNSLLTSLSGLDNIDTDSVFNLIVEYNSLLSSCDVNSICNYLLASGISVIHDNSAGCNNQEEVEAACEVGIGESSVVSRQSLVSIYPNPATDLIFIEIPGITSQFQISIFDLSGQEVIARQASGTNKDLDISALPGGVYFVRITVERKLFFRKFVKIDK